MVKATLPKNMDFANGVGGNLSVAQGRPGKRLTKKTVFFFGLSVAIIGGGGFVIWNIFRIPTNKGITVVNKGKLMVKPKRLGRLLEKAESKEWGIYIDTKAQVADEGDMSIWIARSKTPPGGKGWGKTSLQGARQVIIDADKKDGVQGQNISATDTVAGNQGGVNASATGGPLTVDHQVVFDDPHTTVPGATGTVRDDDLRTRHNTIARGGASFDVTDRRSDFSIF